MEGGLFGYIHRCLQPSNQCDYIIVELLVNHHFFLSNTPSGGIPPVFGAKIMLKLKRHIPSDCWVQSRGLGGVRHFLHKKPERKGNAGTLEPAVGVAKPGSIDDIQSLLQHELDRITI